jgi:hypothetical protein
MASKTRSGKRCTCASSTGGNPSGTRLPSASSTSTPGMGNPPTQTACPRSCLARRRGAGVVSVRGPDSRRSSVSILPVAHGDLMRGIDCREGVVVRDDEERRPATRVEREEELVDAVTRPTSRGFPWARPPARALAPARARARGRRAAARHPTARLDGGTSDARGRPRRARPSPWARCPCRRRPLDEPRHHHVLERVEFGQEVMELEDEADRRVADVGERAWRSRGRDGLARRGLMRALRWGCRACRCSGAGCSCRRRTAPTIAHDARPAGW